MNDERTGEGGAANMPPFPPIPRTETESAPEAERASAPSDSEINPFEEPAPIPAEPLETMGDVTPPYDADAKAEPPLRRDEEEIPRAEAEQTFAERPFAEQGSAREHRSDQARSERRHAYGNGAAGEARRRAADGITRTFARLADRLEEAAERIDDFAVDERFATGPAQRIGATAAATSDWMEDVAEYLRASDLETLRDDIERRVRDRPLQSVMIALGAGWLFGRVMR